MPTTVTLTQTLTVTGGGTYSQTVSATGNSKEATSPLVPAAKTGQLTTRTDNDTGVLTMDAGHGFITNDLVDVFWAGGSRRGMTATVATNAVTVDGGSGDNLPLVNTPVTAMKPVQVPFSLTGDDLDSLASFSPVSGWVVYRNGTTALLAHQILPPATSRSWIAGGGVTNPLAGVSPTNVLFSHADSTQSREMSAEAVF
jgi:hypothetical protein